jgi:predicted dehydrogenase
VSGPLRVALLGCGAIGELVSQEVYARHAPGCAAVAAIDTRPDRAAAVAARLGAEAFTSLAEARAAVAFDAVDIRLPHHLHAPAALEALDAGLHVLVEKPLATTAHDAGAMVDAADRAGLTLAVAENYPHLRAVRDARAALATIGDVLAVRTTRVYRLEGVWLRDGWRVGEGAAAGLLLDQGTHHVSLVRQLAGEVRAVAAAATSGPDARETIALTLWLEDGTLAQSLYGWGSPDDPGQPEASVYGTRGRVDVHVAYDTEDGRAVVWPPDLAGAPAGGENYYDSHRAIVADWVRAIGGDGSPLVGGEDALRDLEVVLAAQRSLEEGGLVAAVGEVIA